MCVCVHVCMSVRVARDAIFSGAGPSMCVCVTQLQFLRREPKVSLLSKLSVGCSIGVFTALWWRRRFSREAPLVCVTEPFMAAWTIERSGLSAFDALPG